MDPARSPETHQCLRPRAPEGLALTAGGGLRGLLFTAALEALLDHHVEVSEDHEGERDVEAAAVFLHQEVALELPHLVIVLLDRAHGVAGGRGDKVKPRLPRACRSTANHSDAGSKPSL